ncbi:MAG: hypothetical protein ABIE43_02565 [Patescibacteria group bacterium]
MRNDIIAKLNHHLLSHKFSSEVWTDLSVDIEAWIVYLFVQIRKILDLDKTGKYKILRLYCSWIVHVKLDQNNQAKKIIEKTAKYLNDESCAEANEVIEILNFITLQKELYEFLQENNLPTDIILSKKGEWFEFRKILIQILLDQPLEMMEDSDSHSIVKLALIKNDDMISAIKDNFINFEATLKSGETIEWRTLLGDYGGERKARTERKNKEFWERFLIKKGYYLEKIK